MARRMGAMGMGDPWYQAGKEPWRFSCQGGRIGWGPWWQGSPGAGIGWTPRSRGHQASQRVRREAEDLVCASGWYRAPRQGTKGAAAPWKHGGFDIKGNQVPRCQGARPQRVAARTLVPTEQGAPSALGAWRIGYQGTQFSRGGQGRSGRGRGLIRDWGGQGREWM